MKKFEAEALASNGQRCLLCFLASSQEAACQKIRERHLTLCHLRELPWSPNKQKTSGKNYLEASAKKFEIVASAHLGREVPWSPGKQKTNAKKFEIVASDPLGREVILSFLAPSEDAARQFVQQKKLALRHICELPWSPNKQKTSGKNYLEASAKKFEIVASDLLGREIRLSFFALSEDAARQIVQQKHLTLRHLHEVPCIVPKHILKRILSKQSKESSAPPSPPQATEVKLIYDQKGLAFVISSPVGWLEKYLNTSFRQEKIVLTSERLHSQVTFGGIILREKRYFISDITNVRHFTESTGFHELLFFYYRKLPVMLCRNADRELIHSLTTSIADTLRFSCQSVERIVFGTPSEIPGPEIDTLHNPDVVELTVPFIRLREICIDPQTYNFHFVERFLTYALNHIGSETLKSRVEVRVYGELQELHPNIRNNLTNLCRRVRESGKKWLAEDRIEHG